VSADDLFASAVAHDRRDAPLAARMRPRSLSDLVGQEHLLREGSPLRRLVEGESVPSLILWGPPGTGKTSVALLVSRATKQHFVELSAVTAGVKDVRAAIESARDALSMQQVGTVLFVDEVHRFSKTQQDALLPAVENGWVTLVAATTENPSFSVVAPLLSRSLLLTLEPLTDDHLRILLDRALDLPHGLNSMVSVDDEAADALVRLAGGDARRLLTSLDAAAGVASSKGQRTITTETLAQAVNRHVVRYDRDGDQHYDVISAFIKSVRGSDVDAAMHYLVRMMEAGEDPRFIARRLVILASEDVGLADPTALQTAVAAHHAVQFIGMPEGRYALSQATIALALAPKSNSVTMALSRAVADVSAGRIGTVPSHLRDSHYAGSTSLGHGLDYTYPHDVAGAVAAQQYLPDVIADARYYHPTSVGAEHRLGELWARLRSLLGRD
jgi:putative ATPase